MKTLYLIVFFLASFMLSAQQVPNGDFENWIQSASYAEPTGWDTPNSFSSPIAITVSKETSIVQSGSSSVKIQTKSILGTPIPGLITLGDFNINLVTSVATITGGAPFTHKPQALHGFFQYEPVFNDEAFIGAVLLKQNGSNWDTIAYGNFKSTATVLTWTPFTATFDYLTNDTPTHLNIIIMSSDRNAPQPNSTLYIDNLSLSYPAQIQRVSTQSPIISYSLGAVLILNNSSQKGIREIEIFNLPGQRLILLNPADPSLGSYSVPFRGYPSGIYFMKLTYTDGTFFTGKFMAE